MPDPHTDASRRRLEMILEQIETLPTLSAIAVRVLNLSSKDDADVREIVGLIESDPALSAKVLSLCRRADRATGTLVTTVDRAVMMIGLDALRASMLSIEVFGLLGEMERDPLHDSKNIDQSRLDDPIDGPRLDRAQFWRHCIAVGCASELIARAHPDTLAPLQPGEAFLGGLLHDLGKLALDYALPRTYRRVIAIADRKQMNIAEVERRVIGLDHHVAGKRMGEHWALPHALQDVMWLHDQSPRAIPDLPHRALIGVVSVADAVGRALHIGWSGNFSPDIDLPGLCEVWELDYARVRAIESELHEYVSKRTSMLGLSDAPNEKLLLESVAQANRRLGRMASLIESHRDNGPSARALAEIPAFLAGEPDASSVSAALVQILRSVHTVYAGSLVAFLWQPRSGAPWRLYSFTDGGRLCDEHACPALDGDVSSRLASQGQAIVPTDSEFLGWAGRAIHGHWPADRRARFCVLRDASPAIVLCHSSDDLHAHAADASAIALARTWGAAASAAARHSGARRLGEELAETNRRVADMQQELVEERSLARLGRLTAGAAHEMNNPLMIISGSAQQLASANVDPSTIEMTQRIVRASEKLGALIGELSEIAEPPEPACRPVCVRDLLTDAVVTARKGAGIARPEKCGYEVTVSCAADVDEAWIDADQIGAAVTELLCNAMQASPRSFVQVRAQIDGSDDRLMITVKDDAKGMDGPTLASACDPFFSSLPAGRRSGLGLARARRYVELHAGELRLESTPGVGTTAGIELPRWRAQRGASERAA